MTSTRHIAARWYAFGYLREVVLIYPVYAIMMGANGIAPLELSALFIVWSGSALVFEVPSGVLADRYSRKRLLAASGLVKGSVFVVWWFAPNFWGYLSGFIVWGFGSSLVSGTSESFLFDTLKQRGQTDAFARIYGRGLMANSLGVATALAGGGYAARAGYALPLVASALMPMAASLIVALTFVEPPRSAALSQPRFTGTLAAGLKEVRGNRTMLRIVAMFATLVTAYGVLDEYVGPFLIETREFSLGAIGVIYASLYAMRTLGMEAAHRLPPRSLRATAAGARGGHVGTRSQHARGRHRDCRRDRRLFRAERGIGSAAADATAARDRGLRPGHGDVAREDGTTRLRARVPALHRSNRAGLVVQRGVRRSGGTYVRAGDRLRDDRPCAR
jgi:MFS family permease